MSRNILISVVALLLVMLGVLGFIYYQKTSVPVISTQEIAESKAQFLQNDNVNEITPRVSTKGDYGNGITYFDISGVLEDFKIKESRYVMTITTENSRRGKLEVDIDLGSGPTPVALKWAETVDGVSVKEFSENMSAREIYDLFVNDKSKLFTLRVPLSYPEINSAECDEACGLKRDLFFEYEEQNNNFFESFQNTNENQTLGAVLSITK